MHGRHQGPKPRVDDTCGCEEFEHVGGDAKKVQQEGDGHIYASEEAHDPGGREPRILACNNRGAAVKQKSHHGADKPRPGPGERFQSLWLRYF